MKEQIKKIISFLNNWKIIIIILLIGAGLFYWYQIRPSTIYSKCSQQAEEKTKGIEGAILKKLENIDYETFFLQCLRRKGINK